MKLKKGMAKATVILQEESRAGNGISLDKLETVAVEGAERADHSTKFGSGKAALRKSDRHAEQNACCLGPGVLGVNAGRASSGKGCPRTQDQGSKHRAMKISTLKSIQTKAYPSGRGEGSKTSRQRMTEMKCAIKKPQVRTT